MSVAGVRVVEFGIKTIKTNCHLALMLPCYARLYTSHEELTKLSRATRDQVHRDPGILRAGWPRHASVVD